MEKFLTDLIESLLPLNNIYIYLFLFLSAIIENLFPPIPGDTITVFGAFLVGKGRLNYFGVYLSTTIGSVIGFMLLFLLAKYFGKKFFHDKNYKHFSIKKIEKTEKWIHKYGNWIIIFNRFLPTVRSVISVVSGISELNTTKVLILSLISASVWNLIWIHSGYVLGNNWHIVKERFSDIMLQYNMIAGAVVILLAVIALIIRKFKNKKVD
ncbi:MAG: DedA family protein [Spirochaetes bacterium]|nr:DedA family protein [Spirochaetota bacterium]